MKDAFDRHVREDVFCAQTVNTLALLMVASPRVLLNILPGGDALGPKKGLFSKRPSLYYALR